MSDEPAALQQLKKQMRCRGGYGDARHPQTAGAKRVRDKGSDRGRRHAPRLVDQVGKRELPPVGPPAFHADQHAEAVLKENRGLQLLVHRGLHERNNSDFDATLGQLARQQRRTIRLHDAKIDARVRLPHALHYGGT